MALVALVTPARHAEIEAYIARLDLDQLPGWTVEQRIIADLWEELGLLRDEISDRANVEADLRAQLAELTEAVPDAWEEGFADGANYMTKYTPKRANPYPGPP